MKIVNVVHGLCVAVFVVLIGPPSALCAELWMAKPYIQAHPADDRDDLADLAPPANEATRAGTYGDAAFARPSRAARQGSGADRQVRAACPGHTVHTTVRGCLHETSRFFAQTYVYTPSYVSAPQVFRQTPRRPSPLLPPVTAFFLDPLP